MCEFYSKTAPVQIHLIHHQKSHARHFHCERHPRGVISFPSFKGMRLTRNYSLRSIIRNILATGPPGITPAFTNAARSRLRQTNCKVNPYLLFRKQTHNSPAIPLPHLHDVLTRARSLFGAGMGFASLSLLASIIRGTIGLRWEDDSDMADFLAAIDSDITQAIQVSGLGSLIQQRFLLIFLCRVVKRNTKQVELQISPQHAVRGTNCEMRSTRASPMSNLGMVSLASNGRC